MADKNSSKTELSPVAGDHAQNDVFPDRILTGGRLVKEYNCRVCDESTGQRHPLLHTAGQLGWVFMNDIGKFHLLNPGHHFLDDIFIREVCRLSERKGNVFKDGHGIKESIVLKHVADLNPAPVPFFSAHLFDRLSLEKYASFIGFQEPDNMLEENAFSRATFAYYRRYLVFINIEISSIKNRISSETLCDIPEFY